MSGFHTNRMWIFLQIAALAAVSLAQQDCQRGACYPPVGDLLLGRGQHLKASSTCGTTGTEIFCSPFGQWKMKCCPCDSRIPSGPNAHTIQNVLSTAGPNRWWQSKKDVSSVSLELDLPSKFQLDTLVLSFKGPRPDALMIERTNDSGLSWQPALYMAADCPSTFPHISTSLPRSMEETYCYKLPPVPTNPYQDQRIFYHPLLQFSNIPVSNADKIERVSDFNGLRVNLNKLGHVPRLPGGSPSHYYALKELKVMGSCFCHGHANRCLPDPSTNLVPNTEVDPVCECQHNTAGANCERCADLYNDLPWRPAEERNSHTCKRCECNNHARKCRFDQAVFEASGGRSGGVCEECMHHTTGPNCERCAPNYQPNPRSNMQSPDACLRCQCTAAGAENGGQCDPVTGKCRCKANVEGPNCDRCRSGYYGLSASNPLGCSKCECSAKGSRHSTCDRVTGQCECRSSVQGLACDRCADGYWNPSSATGCEPCNCDPINSYSKTCDQKTGQCECRTGYGGRTCSGCPEHTYGDPLIGCRPCKCDIGGTMTGGCDKRTGECRCRLGVTGTRCDSCKSGHCARFPECQMCPSCYFTLDSQLKNLTISLERLSSTVPHRPGGGRPHADLGPRIRALEEALADIQDSIPETLSSVGKLSDALPELQNLQDQYDKLRGDLPNVKQYPELERKLKELQSLLADININFNTKRDAFRNATSTNNAGAIKAIEDAYKESNDALEKADATADTVDNSEGIRQDALDMQERVQPPNTRDLEKLSKDLESQPNLTPTAKKVCGTKRVAPCTPAQCSGELCPAGGGPPCGREGPCEGALPIGNKAVKDTEEAKAKLKALNDKITRANEQIQESQDAASRVRLSTDEVANQIKGARDDLETDLRDTRHFVKKLKDFLSDPSSDPTQIQKVCEGILNAKLPVSLAALRRKLEEIRQLATNLPDSSKVLDETTPQLEKARKLLDEAKNARDVALGVQGDVDGLLNGVNEQEDNLGDMDTKVKESLDLIDDVQKKIKKTEDDLTPAQRTLGEVTKLVSTLGPHLEDLKEAVDTGRELAGNAMDNATNAQEEAGKAAEGLEALKKLVEDLKQAAEDSGQAGEAGERLKKLKEEADTLLEDTAGMMKELEDKEAAVKEAGKELQENAGKLTGLETQLEKILADIRERTESLDICQG